MAEEFNVTPEWLADNLVALISAALAIVGLGWNLKQDLSRKASMKVELANATLEYVPSSEGERAAIATHSLELRLANVSEEVPLTLIEVGFRATGTRALTACEYFSGPWIRSEDRHSPAWREKNQPLTLLASQATYVTVHTTALCPSTDLDRIYARCSRGRVAWLPDDELQKLLADHFWPSREETDGSDALNSSEESSSDSDPSIGSSGSPEIAQRRNSAISRARERIRRSIQFARHSRTRRRS